MLRSINSLDITEGAGREMSAEEAELYALRGEKVADRIEDDPRFARVAADPGKGVEAANGSGSFEALMGGWLSTTSGNKSFDISLAQSDS
jgi:hypothetical protein